MSFLFFCICVDYILVNQIQSYVESTNSTFLHELTLDFQEIVVTMETFTSRQNNCSLELCNVVTDILINMYLLKKNFKWRIEWMAQIWINIKSEMFSLMFHTGYEGKKTLQKKKNTC